MIDFEDFARLTDVQWRSRSEVERGVFLAEGTMTIARALAAGHVFRAAITESRWLDDLLALGIPREQVSLHTADEMEAITGYHVHRGALAAFERPGLPEITGLLTAARRVVVLEDVVDHTNVGAILRSAAAFSIDAALLTPSCADPLYRRAIKVSMGAVFALPWTRVPWPSGLSMLHERGFTSLALTPDPAALDLRHLPKHLPGDRWALVLGTEGAGLRSATLESCSARVRIPMSHGVDSLNVAAAAAVACFALAG